MEGVAHVFRTQRHMRFHFLVLVLVILAGLAFQLNRTEMLILLFTVTLVLMAEMFNTAVEAVVDLVTQTYHPLAKFAKDIAAGAVLITVLNALIVAFLLFFGGKDWPEINDRLGLHKPNWEVIAATAFLLLMVIIIMWKVSGRKGKLWKGGIVSAHSALGFFLATTVLFVSENYTAAAMAFILAVVIGQSRVEARIHTLREVVTGALLGTILTAVIYYLVIPHTGLH